MAEMMIRSLRAELAGVNKQLAMGAYGERYAKLDAARVALEKALLSWGVRP